MRIIHPKFGLTCHIPVFAGVRAGFPSPAEDYTDLALDLNEHLVRHKAATYFVYAQGDSMVSYGIESGDLLIVDRSVSVGKSSIIIAAIEGQLTCKLLDLDAMCLRSGNPAYPPIPLTDDIELINEGVVVCSIRFHRCWPW